MRRTFLYWYAATVLKVHDGDTAHFRFDLGFNIRWDQTVRFYGINSPELPTDAGKAARDALVKLLPQGSAVVLNTVRDQTEKYGRYLAVVYKDDVNVNQWMIEHGYAVPFMVN